MQFSKRRSRSNRLIPASLATANRFSATKTDFRISVSETRVFYATQLERLEVTAFFFKKVYHQRQVEKTLDLQTIAQELTIVEPKRRDHAGSLWILQIVAAICGDLVIQKSNKLCSLTGDHHNHWCRFARRSSNISSL